MHDFVEKCSGTHQRKQGLQWHSDVWFSPKTFVGRNILQQAAQLQPRRQWHLDKRNQKKVRKHQCHGETCVAEERPTNPDSIVASICVWIVQTNFLLWVKSPAFGWYWTKNYDREELEKVKEKKNHTFLKTVAETQYTNRIDTQVWTPKKRG